MTYADLTLLGTILLSAMLSAFLGLYAMSMIDLRRRRDPSIFEAPAQSVVFLFEDDDLIDATAGARQLLSATPRDGSAWSRLLKVLLPRFPNLGEEMSRLVDDGAVSLTSTDGNARLEAEWRQGMARISLIDVARADCEVAVDRHALSALEGELEVLRGIADRVPYLTWKESAEGEITWANAAYLDVADTAGPATPLKPWPPRALFPRHEPGAGEAQSRIAVRLSGDRHESWFEMLTLDTDEGALRLALPADAIVRAEVTQQSFIQTLTKTFANLTVGLVIFDRTRKLVLFNPALADLTGLATEFLLLRPSLHSFIDALRETRMLPDPKNFETWRQRLSDLESAAVNGTFGEAWTLPDGRVFQVSGRPHPDGAIAFLIEDVSAEMSLTRQFRAELQLGQAVLDTLDEALAVFGEDGLLALANAAFYRLWNVDPRQAATALTLSQALRDWRSDSPTAPDWARIGETLASDTLRRPQAFTVERLTGRRMDCRFVPLAGGALLVGFDGAPAMPAPVFRHQPKALARSV